MGRHRSGVRRVFASERQAAPAPLAAALMRVVGGWQDLLFPLWCPVCGASAGRDGVCAVCRALLHEAAPAVSALSVRGFELPVLAGCESRAGASLTAAFKDHERFELVPALAAVLRRAACCCADGVEEGRVVLVPVPATARSLRRRGYWPLGRIVDAAIRPWPEARSLPGALRWSRRTRDQRGLGAAARWRNTDAALACDEAQVAGRRVLLVDDVVTSGATAHAAACALIDAGAILLGIACVARVGSADSS